MGLGIWFPLQANGEVKILISNPPEKEENDSERVNDPDSKSLSSSQRQ